MRPKSMPMHFTSSLPALPPNKSITQVFADMLSYLLSCGSKFIQDTHPLTARSWPSLRESATFVIAHPNGWEGVQQNQLKSAAILGRLVPDTLAGRARVVFVTEGEASLHFCVKGRFVDESQRGFVVADLGGGTLDFSAYKVVGISPLRVEESAPVKCMCIYHAYTLRFKHDLCLCRCARGFYVCHSASENVHDEYVCRTSSLQTFS